MMYCPLVLSGSDGNQMFQKALVNGTPLISTSWVFQELNSLIVPVVARQNSPTPFNSNGSAFAVGESQDPAQVAVAIVVRAAETSNFSSRGPLFIMSISNLPFAPSQGYE